VVGGWLREILAIFYLEILGELEISLNIAIIRSWRSQFGKIPARDFPDNRCYMTRPKRSVGRVQRGKGA